MYLIKSSGKTGGQKNSKEADNMILKKNSLMNLQTSLIDLKISCKRATLGWAKMRTVWFRYTLFSICTFPNLHGFRSAQISICTDFDLQSRTFSSLHGFRSAQFSLCNFWICKDFALLSIRSAQISICTDFDLHVFRYANQF